MHDPVTMTKPKTATKTRKPSGRSLTPEERAARGLRRMTLWLTREAEAAIDALSRDGESRTATILRVLEATAASLKRK